MNLFEAKKVTEVEISEVEAIDVLRYQLFPEIEEILGFDRAKSLFIALAQFNSVEEFWNNKGEIVCLFFFQETEHLGNYLASSYLAAHKLGNYFSQFIDVYCGIIPILPPKKRLILTNEFFEINRTYQ